MQPLCLRSRLFSLIGSPKFVVLGERGLEGVGGELGVDVTACAAAVAGVFAVCFAEELGQISTAALRQCFPHSRFDDRTCNNLHILISVWLEKPNSPL